MLSALRKILLPEPPAAAHASYIALVAAARNEFFYAKLGVPDTLDGRFELIVLHLFLLQQRMKDSHPDFCRDVSEVFFADMDRSLREIGVSDTGVSYRIKAMGKAYHGRLQAYAAGLSDAQLLRAALARNLYGTVAEGDVTLLDAMAIYIEKTLAGLSAVDEKLIASAEFQWPEPASFIS